MKRQLFANRYGDTASITKQAEEYKLICKNNRGKEWKRDQYNTVRDAKDALAETDETWYTTRGYVE